MKSGSMLNARLSDEFFFETYQVEKIDDHSNIEELAAKYDGSHLDHYMDEEKAHDLVCNFTAVLEEDVESAFNKFEANTLADEGPMEGLHH